MAPPFADAIVGEGDEGVAHFMHRDAPVVWAPTCNGASRARFVARFEAAVGADPNALFTLDSFDLTTEWRRGAMWRRGCGEAGVVVAAPPADAGDWCDGSHARACQEGLTCEYDLARESGSEGICVNPSERLPPAGLEESCGGLRQIACAEGLVCWQLTQDAVDNHWLGRCRAPQGGEGVACNQGVPELPCRAGLFCRASSRLCVAADGQLGSACGEGLPACASGLKCGAGETCIRTNDFPYLRSTATGFGFDEASRLFPFAGAPKVFARTFNVTDPASLTTGDAAIVTATNQLDGAGSSRTDYVTATSTVDVPGTATLVPPPQVGDSRKARFTIEYRQLGLHRALVNFAPIPPTLTIQSVAEVCANIFCPSRLHCELMQSGEPTCVLNP